MTFNEWKQYIWSNKPTSTTNTLNIITDWECEREGFIMDMQVLIREIERLHISAVSIRDAIASKDT